jgi:hypothetical protein
LAWSDLVQCRWWWPASTGCALETFWWSPAIPSSGNSWRAWPQSELGFKSHAVDVALICVYCIQSLLEVSSCGLQETVTCMRQLSRLLRANCFSSSLRTCRPVFSTPPCLVHPTKSFATTPARLRFEVPTRKTDNVVMAGDMTTYKGKPFDRPSLESLMRVRAMLPVQLGSSHTNQYSADYSTHPPSTSMVECPASTTSARPAAP